jgi:small subunit ribosomal protein S18
MARNNDRERTSRRAPKDLGRRQKKKVCLFCRDGIDYVDYKDVNLLRKFMSDRGKIRARRVSGNCAQHQRAVARAIKTTRELALLPYTQRTTNERPGGRGGRGGRGGPRGESRSSRGDSDVATAPEVELDRDAGGAAAPVEESPVESSVAADGSGEDSAE